MSPTSYQTIRLSNGKHASPDEGACVMELASMLAGEPFSDHPKSVCPVIGAFLRAYNDSINDRRRQDLYAYAAKIVGSRTTAEVQRVRAERLAEWACEMFRRREPRFLTRVMVRLRRPSIDAAGASAVSSISKHTDETHAAALALVDELLQIRAPDGRVLPPALTGGRTRPLDVASRQM